ncbi:MAG: DMT family transporter [Armatimonadetes bacterium]|nr:DMT family transporter [Armatimonadota bacterium]
MASALAYLLWNKALAVTSTVTAGAYLYLIPVIAGIIAAVFLGEIPGFYLVAGGVMALAGTYFAGK